MKFPFDSSDLLSSGSLFDDAAWLLRAVKGLKTRIFSSEMSHRMSIILQATYVSPEGGLRRRVVITNLSL